MSDQSPDDSFSRIDPSNPMSGSKRSTRYFPELARPSNRIARKLFRILLLICENLDHESHRREPRKVWKQACDMMKVLPRWWRYLEEVPASINHIELYETVTDAYDNVYKTAEEARKLLQPHIKTPLDVELIAEEQCKRLRDAVYGALESISLKYIESSQSSSVPHARKSRPDTRVSPESIQ